MRKRLDGGELPAPEWPSGFFRVRFDPAALAVPAHKLLDAAYARGGGVVLPWPEWWNELHNDPEYDSELCFAVGNGKPARLVAFAQCWTSGFVKDIAVAGEYRRCGIGRALMLEVFRVFRSRGADRVDLKVESDNPSGAVHFYRALGMRVVEEGA